MSLTQKWPVYNESCIDMILDAANNLDRNKYRNEFEEKFAAFTDVKHAILCANGTVSIEMILRALEIGYGDEVILPPYTFIATISSVIFAGAVPVFADIDPNTYCISAESVEKMITPKTKAVIAVHVGGRPSDMDALQNVADKHGIYLIGDAAQAVGAVWKGRGIGSYGIMSSFSLQNSKNLTSGEGGIITTDSDELAERIRSMLSFDGKYISADHNISEMQAAVLCHQMELIPEHMVKRSENEAYLDSLLADIPYVSTLTHDDRVDRNALHLYFIRIHEDKLNGVTRKEFIKELNAAGVPLTSGYVPLYDFKCLKNSYTKKNIGADINVKPDTPVAEYIARHEASWLYQACLLGEREDMEFIAEAIKNTYAKLCTVKEDK